MTAEKDGKIHFYKMTGAGNDFVFIDNRGGAIDADNCDEFVRTTCRRKLAVGADGMVLIENDPEVDFRWRFFNSDASEAEMCGNAARCAVRFAHLTGIVVRPKMSFRTIAGIIRGEILGDTVKVQMTLPHSLELGLDLDSDRGALVFDCIDTGVPHAVHFLSDEKELESVDIAGLGRTFRFHSRFQPAGSNVNFACIVDPQHMTVRTYERGVEGETLACGTGVMASALTAAARSRVTSPISVKTRGGEFLTVHFRQAEGSRDFDEVYLEGEARVVYEADLYL